MPRGESLPERAGIDSGAAGKNPDDKAESTVRRKSLTDFSRESALPGGL